MVLEIPQLVRLPLSYILATPIALAALAPLLVLVILADDFASVLAWSNVKLLFNTLALALLSAAGAIVIGVPLAIVSAYGGLMRPGLTLALFASPLAIPSYLGAFALYAALGPGGELEQWLGFATPPIGGLGGSALVIALYTYPFVLLTTRAALLSQDGSLVDAARTLGLNQRQCLMRVVLPRAIPAIAAGALLSALYAVSDFGTPAIMNYDTFTRLIYLEYNAYGLSQAALFSLQLLLIVGLILFFEGRFRASPERAGSTLRLRFSRGGVLFTVLLAVPVVTLALLLPLGIFLLWLVREGIASFDPALAWNSMLASALAALLATCVALPIALASRRGRFGRVLERAIFFGFGVPGIVMGTVLVYVGLQIPVLYQTLLLLVVAYVMRFFSLAVSSTRSSFDRLDEGVGAAARLLGARRLEVLFRITLPLSARGIIAGAALVFLESMRELPATLLLAPTGFETLATYLWRVYEAGYFGRAAVPSLLLVLMSTLGLALVLAGESRTRDSVHGPRGS